MLKVVFLHPDLGIGGAERLVVDAAVALRSRGCAVQIWTAHHDPRHCFPETRDPELPVVCVGDWLPTSIFGYFHALCAYVRMVYVALYLIFLSGVEFDVAFCDQVSVCIPILRLTRQRKRVLFYCHYPDQLLTQRHSALKRIYRAPIDRVEEITTGMADCVLVNSRFTAGVFKRTFASLAGVRTDVLYPSLNPATFDGELEELDGLVPDSKRWLFLSINRYERKKNLPLALRALEALLARLNPEQREQVHLVLAGGYDERVAENVEHFSELKALASALGLEGYVTFLRSPSDQQKVSLLHHSSCVLYTPSDEHFGIVPVEAMYARCPVVAVKSGGPLESVSDKETGFLCPARAENFAEAMEKFVNEPQLQREMGEAGRRRVLQKFSSDAFSERLYRYVSQNSVVAE
ncbi:alpha-1,3/1,6-mannosyltransferase ALG2 [Paramormyrops kingsleyae]|nr:alpha-1,3/1,6-mannosyltransferase ALG2 [Paramormyrops kingsleyae]XP_023671323.1 alpha-1,3/1,6-mannosyltransferase ALG2 [Paramormyrops kingsleyae]XP_023671329.1 alpha-1,3/1,6-mannosyltransferase ALG2 [Paramormyrops kingsleyae]